MLFSFLEINKYIFDSAENDTTDRLHSFAIGCDTFSVRTLQLSTTHKKNCCTGRNKKRINCGSCRHLQNSSSASYPRVNDFKHRSKAQIDDSGLRL